LASGDWTALTGGLGGASVAQGVTSGVVKPNGGGDFVYGFNSLALVDGAVGLHNNQANFAPMSSGGSVRGAIKRAPGGTLLSVNISARTLTDFQIVDRIAARCLETGIDPALVSLELTETSAMEDPVMSLDLLTRFRMKGFQLSLDDFGTGYSSMLQLVRLPFSEIKVDKSFVMTAMRSQESRTVVKSVVDLGHSLGLSVTAEGVEDVQTLDYLRSIGCDRAQGFFIGRPMNEDAVATWRAERIQR